MKRSWTQAFASESISQRHPTNVGELLARLVTSALYSPSPWTSSVPEPSTEEYQIAHAGFSRTDGMGLLNRICDPNHWKTSVPPQLNAYHRCQSLQQLVWHCTLYVNQKKNANDKATVRAMMRVGMFHGAFQAMGTTPYFIPGSAAYLIFHCDEHVQEVVFEIMFELAREFPGDWVLDVLFERNPPQLPVQQI